MKVITLIPDYYSYLPTVLEAFKKLGCDVQNFNYMNFFKEYENRLINKTSGLPRSLKIKKYLHGNYFKKINKCYKKIIELEKPDMLFIYNNQLIHPEVLKDLRNIKVCFYLGDNPLYSFSSDYNLEILFYSDLVIAPDTFWKKQLEIIGIKNITFDFFGFDDKIYYPINTSDKKYDQYKSDLSFIGVNYHGAWGYKRSLFLNYFCDFDLKIYATGKIWKEHWTKYFPKLKDKIISYNEHNQAFNNIVYNCSKICPVDANVGTLNGVQIRIIDILGAGSFPLSEYRSDFEIVFDGIDFPIIKDYRDIENLTKHLLSSENVRDKIKEKMRNKIVEKYSPDKVILRIIKDLI